MNDQDDGGPAFPTDHSLDMTFTDIRGGMSLRDWFAGQALAGMLAQGTEGTFSKDLGVTRAAAYAYEYADAMLKARSR